MKHYVQQINWSSGKLLVSGPGGLRFGPWAGQIGQTVVNRLPPLRYLLERNCV